jgi:hypothetical protein
MPQHSDVVKWRKLAEALDWKGEIMDLQRMCLVAISAYPKQTVKDSFMSYYFGSKSDRVPSHYNNLEQVRDAIGMLKNLNFNEEVATKYREFTTEELISGVDDNATV